MEIKIVPSTEREAPVLTGFNLIEVLVVIGIIAILGSIVFTSLSDARGRARDVRRRVEVSQIGRLLSASCYLPDGGGGEYDLALLVEELKIKYPKYAEMLKQTPRDPRIGTALQSHYRYIITADGKSCALYANLEREAEAVTLPAIDAPTPGGGTGVLKTAAEGWNGSTKYFQVSN